MIDLIIIQNMLALASGVSLAVATAGYLRLRFVIVALVVVGLLVSIAPQTVALMLVTGLVASQGIVKRRQPPSTIVNNAVNVDLTEIYKVVKTAMQDYLNGDEFAGKE